MSVRGLLMLLTVFVFLSTMGGEGNRLYWWCIVANAELGCLGGRSLDALKLSLELLCVSYRNWKHENVPRGNGQRDRETFFVSIIFAKCQFQVFLAFVVVGFWAFTASPWLWPAPCACAPMMPRDSMNNAKMSFCFIVFRFFSYYL